MLIRWLDVVKLGDRRAELIILRRNLSSTTFLQYPTANSYAKDGRGTKLTHWKEEAKLLNNVTRALAHYDDFYASVYGTQWPSLRLGLLSPAKYMAIPNTFTGNVDVISGKLRQMGSFNVRQIWEQQAKLIENEKKEFDMKKDLGRLHQLDLTLESIAATKKAEEMDIIYQNAPTSKRQDMELGREGGRVVSSIAQAGSHFVPATKLKGVEDFTFDSEYFSSYIRKNDEEGSDSSVDDEQEVLFLKAPISTPEFPKLLLPHSFENGSSMMFPPAERDEASDLRNYICINGGSIIPVIALDCRPGNNFLDLCSGPGTKSLLLLMTMAIDSMVCNDVDANRLKRVQRIFKEFIGAEHPPNVSYTRFNAAKYPAVEEFSRVLVDVPCLNDRVSCTISDNNIFKARRTKERLQLVSTQREILLSGFNALDKNEASTIVYSTCTLSPVENDGVVMNALKETDVRNLHIDLIGLMKLITPFERAGVFKIMRTRCGVLIMPNVASNFGPMYVSRIVVHHPLGQQINETSPVADSPNQTV